MSKAGRAVKKIGFLGPGGTFSEMAAREYVGHKVTLVPYETLYDLILAADRGVVTAAVAPLENSLEGSVNLTLDMLVKEVDLRISREIVLHIHHYLLGWPGTKLDRISEVFAHPQASGQCHEWLRKNLKQAKVHPTESNAQSVELVARSKNFWQAAIGPKRAGEIYGLKVLASHINDFKENQTRFVVLAKKDSPATGRDKTSIVFSTLRDRPGGLYEILGEFASRAINMTRIESRPSRKMLGDYVFFIDLAGHREDPKVAQALAAVRRKASFFKMLGSYPV